MMESVVSNEEYRLPLGDWRVARSVNPADDAEIGGFASEGYWVVVARCAFCLLAEQAVLFIESIEGLFQFGQLQFECFAINQ